MGDGDGKLLKGGSCVAGLLVGESMCLRRGQRHRVRMGGGWVNCVGAYSVAVLGEIVGGRAGLCAVHGGLDGRLRRGMWVFIWAVGAVTLGLSVVVVRVKHSHGGVGCGKGLLRQDCGWMGGFERWVDIGRAVISIGICSWCTRSSDVNWR